VAVLGGVVTVKRFDMYLEGFQHLDQLMGGPLPRGSSILLLGDAGSGKTILSYQLLHEELDSGKLCALLSYDAFPEDVQARMNEFGWDIVSHLRKGRLKIIDCYSSLAGQGEGAIKDPSDLTELNIQVTAFIGRAKGAPVTVVLDSLTPIFNGVEEKQAINFIQTLGAKVKKTGGLFILTASKGAIPDESAAKLKTILESSPVMRGFMNLGGGDAAINVAILSAIFIFMPVRLPSISIRTNEKTARQLSKNARGFGTRQVDP